MNPHPQVNMRDKPDGIAGCWPFLASRGVRFSGSSGAVLLWVPASATLRTAPASSGGITAESSRINPRVRHTHTAPVSRVPLAHRKADIDSVRAEQPVPSPFFNPTGLRRSSYLW